jgi:subtilisin
MRKRVRNNGKVTRIRMRAVPESGRRSVIITFKPKERRPDAHLDKLDIVRQAVSAPMSFFDAMSAGPVDQAIPMGLPGDQIGFDVNEYAAPIVVASLTQDEVGKLERNGNVASVEEDGICYAVDAMAAVPYRAEPSPSYGAHQPAPMIIEGQPTITAETIPVGIAQVKAPGAWNCSRGMGIRVAVLDTGIDNAHPDLAPNFAGGVSFVPGQTFKDGNGHGTHCAGTIGAAINGSGVVGVAPSASLYAVKVLSNAGSGQWSWLIAGIDWCIKNGMRVLSMSMGGDTAPAALQLMCDAAFQKGLLLVAAAGNSPVKPVIAPARYRSVIAVSAIDSANNIAAFSARGPDVEVCAPGVNVLSTMPGGGYGTMSGTSMACPHASGTAAVAWGAHRYATNVTMRRLLAWTADNLGVPGRDPLFGFGRVDAAQAAFQLTPPPAIPGLP